MMSHRDISAVTLDGNIRYSDPAIEQERETAIRDLLHENHFALSADDLPAPYWLHLSAGEGRLALDVACVEREQDPTRLQISLQPFRRLIKDYFLIWESYTDAIRSATPERLEAVDMGRRAIHNEGAEMLIAQLSPAVETDLDTARRLFTLICVLHIK